MNPILSTTGKSFAHDPARRGYHAVYYPGEANRCPGCSRSNWYVGRMTAECMFCSTALPLVDGGMAGVGIFRRSTRPDTGLELAA